jgi:hypothetical protein
MSHVVVRRRDMVVVSTVVMNYEKRSSTTGLYIAESRALRRNGKARAARK